MLIDFGIAQAVGGRAGDPAGLVAGTPGYLSPEVLDGGEPSRAADWWGWAAMLAFAATGRPPFGVRPLAAVLARVRTGDVDLDGAGPVVAEALAGDCGPTRRRAAPGRALVAGFARRPAGSRPASIPRCRAPPAARRRRHHDGGARSAASGQPDGDGERTVVVGCRSAPRSSPRPRRRTAVDASPRRRGTRRAAAGGGGRGGARTRSRSPTGCPRTAPRGWSPCWPWGCCSPRWAPGGPA